ncbi:hypothetical protein [Nitrosovibrio tenuis]|nr:hypothetical protein [Nitrosovibrio tenuis]
MASLPDLSLKIVEFAHEHGRIPSAKPKADRGSRNTLKRHFCVLSNMGT